MTVLLSLGKSQTYIEHSKVSQERCTTLSLSLSLCCLCLKGKFKNRFETRKGNVRLSNGSLIRACSPNYYLVKSSHTHHHSSDSFS